MDTTDPNIEFSSDGRCNHCRDFEALIGTVWFPGREGDTRLEAALERIKAEGKGKEFDCVLGLSGGVDSSYLALKAHDWGLRPLVVHVDAGWNSELAVQNIERVVKSCDYELHTHVVNWEDMRQLQLSYLRSAVANQDVPQDHAFFAGLYHFATKNKVRYVLSGSNVATEGITPPNAWGGDAMDSINLRAIHATFGSGTLNDFPLISFSEYYFWYPLVKRMTPVKLLNYRNYVWADAHKELEHRIGWRSYARKHGESLFTKFYQNHYLPTKFGFDKRRPHLSSLIASGQLTRADALVRLDQPLYEPEELRRDTEYLARKLRVTPDEFDELMRRPVHHYGDFPNWGKKYARMKTAQGFVSTVLGRDVTAYR